MKYKEDILVKYSHPASQSYVKLDTVYKMSEVQALCEKYKKHVETYFTPVTGEWKDYEEKPKRKYTKKTEKLEFGEDE